MMSNCATESMHSIPANCFEFGALLYREIKWVHQEIVRERTQRVWPFVAAAPTISGFIIGHPTIGNKWNYKLCLTFWLDALFRPVSLFSVKSHTSEHLLQYDACLTTLTNFPVIWTAPMTFQQCSGYHVGRTRCRSSVRSWVGTFRIYEQCLACMYFCCTRTDFPFSEVLNRPTIWYCCTSTSTFEREHFQVHGSFVC